MKELPKDQDKNRMTTRLRGRFSTKTYNMLTRQKEEFAPIKEGEAKVYVCDPTVYDFIHIGNVRPIRVFDVLRRHMEYHGPKVTYAQNFTSTDDKIIRKVNEEEIDCLAVSRKYIEKYKTNAKDLNVCPATVHPLTTGSMEDISQTIQTLVEKGYAYATPNGDVYFRTRKFDEYGKLSHQPLDDLRAGVCTSVGEVKEDAMDFAVWKSTKSGEPDWDSPWGKGRPGWHVECSTMARHLLGSTIDIHCGGQDLIFPHHENGIVQGKCCNDVPFAHYRAYNGYINADNYKMSKSLNNFSTVREVANVYGYEPIHFLMVSSQYCSPINYSIEIIERCKSALDRLYNRHGNLAFVRDSAPEGLKDGEQEQVGALDSFRQRFTTAMDDDPNTADVISVLLDLAREINTNLISGEKSKELHNATLKLYGELADMLDLLYQRKDQSPNKEIEALIQRCTDAHKNKDWATADRIRDELEARHVVLEDTPQGIKWKTAE